MEQLEKVEKLRERANVSYEEAKEALEASDWDLLDAMVYLEKKGKVKSPSRETYTTNYEEQSQYVSVKDKVQEQEETGNESFFKKAGHLYYQKGRRDFPHACMGADTSASFLLEAFDPRNDRSAVF